jgi:steroid delta-isomerase-like uncharacterized protein
MCLSGTLFTLLGCGQEGPVALEGEVEGGPEMSVSAVAEGPAQADRDFTGEERMKQVIQDRWLNLMNTANIAIADEIYASDFTCRIPNYPQVTDLEGYKREAASAAAVLPEFEVILEDLFAQGDRVVGRFTANGRMIPAASPGLPLPPEGVPYTNLWIIVFRFEDGKIAEEWWQFDLLGVMEQLGAFPPTRETYTWGAASSVMGDPGHPPKNQSLARRAEEVWNTGNLVQLEKVFAPGFVNHDPVMPMVANRESYKGFLMASRAAFPDIYVEIQDVIADGDRVAVRRTVTGTHDGEFAGIPATGRAVSWTGITIYRIADGQIVETWWCYDALGLMMQLTAGGPAR